MYAVVEYTLAETGCGTKSDMRNRAHVDAAFEGELGRAHVLEEDERSDNLGA